MAISVRQEASSGGANLVQLCEFCVCSAQMDPLFVILACDYQMLPANKKALALFDTFCSDIAPKRLTTLISSRPVSGQLVTEIEKLRTPIRVAADTDSQNESEGPVYVEFQHQPAKYLFDDLVRGVVEGSSEYTATETHYDASLTPHENLPGGKMTDSQRHFVDQVWPAMRSTLVLGGFTRMASIG